MIEDIIAKISVPVEIEIKKEDIEFNKLEKKIEEASKSAGCKCFEESLKAIEGYILKEGREEEVVIHAHKISTIETVMGSVRYNYTQVKAKEEKEERYYLILKRALGLDKRQQVSDKMKFKGIMCGSEVSYRASADKLGNKVSHSSIRNWTIKGGENLGKREDKEEIPYKITDKESNQAFVEADGIMIPMQGGKRKKTEVKIAICYRGRENRYKTGESEQKKLKDKVVYGDICKSEKFIERASSMFDYVYNLSKVLYIVILGDGAVWIKEFQRIYNWGVYQLDRFHLLRKLRRHFSRKGEEYEEVKKLIEEDKIEEVIGIIERKITGINEKISDYNKKLLPEEEEKEGYKKRIGFYKRRLKKTHEVLKYIKTNKEGINGIKKYKDIFQEDDLVIGSGGIENEVKITIGSRMKGRGKCWKLRGARAMVKLLCSLANGWYKEEDYIRFLSSPDDSAIEVHQETRKQLPHITKGKREAFSMEQLLKGNIPCNASSSSPMGLFKKIISNYDVAGLLN